MLSVICPIYNEERFIDRCIRSILEQDYPKDRLEFLLVDGRSTDNTREKVAAYARKYPFIRLLDNPHRTVPYAMNIGILASKGEVIVRIDGHCTYPTDYLSELERQLYALGADNVGGLWNTLPAKPTTVCRAIAIASSHPFGVGGSKHKIGATKIIPTDTVPFGCYRREVFDQIGLFDEELTRNQDDELNGRLIRNGGRIYLIPTLVIDYTARNSLKKMCRMYYQYGLFKPLVNKKLGAPATIRQFFPVLFLTGLVAGAVLSFLHPVLATIYFTVLALYLLMALAFSFRAARKQRDRGLLVVLPAVFFLVHASYGWGYLVGICKLLFRCPFTVESNR